MAETKIIVGGGLEEDAGAFLDAWRRAERGERVDETVLAFESWEALAAVMTGERYRLLRHVHVHPEPSVSPLARALGRQYRRVHADVAALEQAGVLYPPPGPTPPHLAPHPPPHPHHAPPPPPNPPT